MEIPCQDTSHLALAGVEAGSVDAEAESHKRINNQDLDCIPFCASGHLYVRSFAPCGSAFFTDLSKHVAYQFSKVMRSYTVFSP